MPEGQSRIPVICGQLGLTIGAVVLLGWALRVDALTRVLPTFIAMNPATAVAMICGGFAVMAPPTRITVTRIAALAVIAIGGLRLAQILEVFSWRVDQVLFSAAIEASRPPNSMRLNTAIALVLLGVSILANTVESRSAQRAAKIIGSGAGALSLLAIFAYALGMGSRFDTLKFVPMALPTALSFGCLTVGNLARRPSLLLTIIRDRGPAGFIARRALPLSMLVPLVLGQARLTGQEAGYYGADVGIALLTAANAWALFLLLLIAIFGLYRSDQARLERETEVVRNENQYRLAEKVARVGHWRLDASEKSVMWSDAMFTLAGVAKEHGVPSSAKILKLYYPEDRAEARAKLLHALKTGEGWEIKTRLIRPDGEIRWVISHGLCEHRSDKKAFAVFGVFADITERENAVREQRYAQEEVQTLQTELIHLQRLNAMGAMAATLAHELNQPLAAISNYSYILDGLVEKNGQAREMSEPVVAIGKAATRAGAIIRKLREMTWKGEITKKSFVLGNIIKEAADLAQIGFDNNFKLHFGLKDGTLVMGDRVQIQQVLINLIRNARDSVGNSENGTVRIVSRRSGNRMCISVEDNGPGIPADLLPRLFDAFFSSKDDGMGLGLCVSRTIIEAHGGRIWAENRPEGGARVSFTLPIEAKAGV